MSRLGQWYVRLGDGWLFEHNDVRYVPWLRMAFALLSLVNALVWWRDAAYWFSDVGVLTCQTAQALNGHARWSLLFLMPSTPNVVNICLALLTTQSVLLFLGVWSRFQIACIFVWLVSFQMRNPVICDGEDTLMRLLAFMMIFLPLDCVWSVTRWLQRRSSSVREAVSADAWALCLIQFQMTLIYASATWCKMFGETWQNGTSMYYVSHMTDHFGRIPNSQYLFQSLYATQVLTWSALAIEAVLPLALWIPQTRRWAVWLGIALHLGIELTMHLFLFEWIMILGLVSFLARSRREFTQSTLSNL